MSILLQALALCLLVGGLLGWAIARYFAWHGFWKGYKAGRADELSHTNAIVMRAKLDAYRTGVSVGSCRMWHLVAKEKAELN